MQHLDLLWCFRTISAAVWAHHGSQEAAPSLWDTRGCLSSQDSRVPRALCCRLLGQAGSCWGCWGLSCSLSKNKQCCLHWTRSLQTSIFEERCFGRTEYALLFQGYISCLFLSRNREGKCVSLAWTTSTQSHSKNYVFRIDGVLQELP